MRVTTRDRQARAFAALYFLSINQFVATMIVMGWSGLWSVGPVVILAFYFASIMREKETPL